jgi:hypothetical protein
LSLQGLRIISGAEKQQLIKILSLCLTYFQDDLALDPKTKFLLHNMNQLGEERAREPVGRE